MSKAYLTIDDAPSPKMKEKIEILKEYEIPTIFFCEGRYIEQRMDAVVEAINKGFIIGNHSYTHPNFSEISVEEAKKEIKSTNKLIERAYDASNRERPGKFFRFPYGDRATGKKQEKLQKFLRERGYTKPDFEMIDYGWYKRDEKDKIDWFWTFDCKEWKIDDLNKILGRIEQKKPEDEIIRELKTVEKEDLKGLKSESADIILIHDHENTHSRNKHEFFRPIIQKLSEMDLEFEHPI